MSSPVVVGWGGWLVDIHVLYHNTGINGCMTISNTNMAMSKSVDRLY